MKFQQQVYVDILSRRSMGVREDYFARFKHHFQSLPMLIPEKWGFDEPLRTPFDLSKVTHVEPWTPSWSEAFADPIYWKKAKGIKATGCFDLGGIRMGEDSISWDRHGRENMSLELKTFPQDEMVRYVSESSVLFDADIALIDTCTDHYSKHHLSICQRYEGFHNGISLSVLNLRHWLFDIFWFTTLGKAYADLFGRDQILSAPAYRVEQLTDDIFIIQLTPNLSDVINDPVGTMAVRERVKQHLGRDAFFSEDKAYPLRGPLALPDGTFPTGISIRDFEYPPDLGTVFRVPNFEIIEDEYLKALRNNIRKQRASKHH